MTRNRGEAEAVKRSLVTAALVAFAMFFVPAMSRAQPAPRSGFTIGFGLGAGSGSMTATGGGSSTTTDRRTDLTGTVHLGGTLRQDLILGGEYDIWSHTEDGGTAIVSLISAVIIWYPNPTGGFFAKGGVGSATTKLSADGVTISASGIGFVVGGGYDWRLARNFSLTAFGHLLYMPEAPVLTSKLGGNLLQLGVGCTWH